MHKRPRALAPPLRLLFCFQAEDGIRDTSVTGVQTCALPIAIVCATTACLRARLRTTPIRSRAQRAPRQRADAQLFMAFSFNYRELRRADSIRSGPRGTKSGSLKQRANWLCLSKNGIAPPANPPAPGVALPRDHRQHQRGRMLRVMADPLAGLHIARVDPAIRIHHPVTGRRRSHSRDAPPAARARGLPRFPSTEERSPAVREAARPASYPEPICRATPATSAWQTMSPLECLAVPVVPAGSPP